MVISVSSTTRYVVGQVAIVLVWIIFLLPLGQALCRVQGDFHYTALVGITIVILGVGIYRRKNTSLPREEEQLPLVKNDDCETD